MKKTIFILLLLSFLIACKSEKATHQEIVTNYYKARDAFNYNALKTVIDDSITVIGGDYVMPYNLDSYYEEFKWDSIFRTSYKIVELIEEDDWVMATVVSNSIKYEFLKNNPLTCQYRISFNSDKISKIESLECLGVNWDIWQEQKDTLVSWIDKNHPKLDGFIHDMTMNGALNYLKAIALYKEEKESL
jgi:hypothetical protein